ncbi:MAG: hypothetical protein V4773_18010 [Verrucomicrobiota bacterium]
MAEVILIVAIALLVLGASVTLYAMMSAREGYEDETGFNITEPESRKVKSDTAPAHLQNDHLV